MDVQTAVCGTPDALACYACVCVTWKSVLGFMLPALVALIYLPRVAREATIDDWLILGFATIFTYASRRAMGGGIAHEPWYVYIAALWGMNACSTDRLTALRSIPLIGVFSFVSLAVPDVISMVTERPLQGYGVPGGNGLLDGLVLKTAMAVGLTYLAYQLKLRPILPNKRRRGKSYDERSKQFLLNMKPTFFRDLSGWEGTLTLVPTAYRDEDRQPPKVSARGEVKG